MDDRKRPIRSLWIRNGNYYARLAVEDAASGTKSVRRVRLEKAQTVPQAQAELRRLQTKREDGDLPALKLTPKFSQYAQEYLDFYTKIQDAKRPNTLATERVHLNSWSAHLGDTRLARLKRPIALRLSISP